MNENVTWKSMVNQLYKWGNYDKSDVAMFVRNGQLTASDYQDITGDVYPAA